ncbi:MAG: transaldolase family protein [Pirellulaceae bacterium]
MKTPLESLIACGTKLWLDSVDPSLVSSNRALGVTGATSNPVIVSELLQSGRFDAEIARLLSEDLDDGQIAWQMTDSLVRGAQAEFLPVWQQTCGDDGYVSFEVDPLLEDPELKLAHAERVRRYVELAQYWAANHDNRMIKVPATPAGLDSLEQLVAAGISVNVTLIFTTRQYRLAREAVWRGAQRRVNRDRFKSVYSIFVSRVDTYTEKHVPQLSAAAQGLVGIVNAKRIWAENQSYWRPKQLPLRQEIVFASTGTKRPTDPPWKYVEAFAGSDIETNPPATNEAVQRSGLVFHRQIDQLPPSNVLAEIDAQVDVEAMERVLMAEGIAKFADPQKKLLAVIAQRR